MRLASSAEPARWRTLPGPARAVLAVVLALALAAYALIAASTTAHAAPSLLSQGKPTTASSTENTSFTAPNATDGNTGTRWSSAFSDPQWNANGGATYFFQDENPYDPPTQSAWMNGSTKGYAAYEVAPSVTTHQAYGVGSYCYFNVNTSIVNDHAFEAPNTAGVQFHDLLTVSLGGVGTISHVINQTGAAANAAATTNIYLSNYP